MKVRYEKFFVVLFLALLSPALFASDYQVEIIVFEHLYHDAEGEIAEVGLDLPDLETAIQFQEIQDENTTGFKALSPGFYKLGGVNNELKFSRDYRPILHLSWQQPALGQSRSRYVRIHKTDSANRPDALTDTMIKLDGVIRIRSSQFLHADVNLFYFVNPVPESYLHTQAPASVIAPEGGLRFAELKETRRMKLNELHYFDHPVFGLFLRVSRIEN